MGYPTWQDGKGTAVYTKHLYVGQRTHDKKNTHSNTDLKPTSGVSHTKPGTPPRFPAATLSHAAAGRSPDGGPLDLVEKQFTPTDHPTSVRSQAVTATYDQRTTHGRQAQILPPEIQKSSVR